jgi:hypothetical protein
MIRLRHLLSLLLLCNGFFLAAHAQWRTQEITLNPGWNAVFLEVDPEPRNCATVLSGLPIESVWLYTRRSAAPQFISDPRQLTPQSPDWLVWVGDASAGPALNTLFAMPGGRPYLVKVSGNQSVIWSIRGRPAIRPQKYEGRAFNFVGFHLDPTVPVSFQSFFAPNAALNNQAVYDLDATGEWRLVNNPATANLRPGRAYWVFATAPTEYSGPSSISVDQQSSIAFGPIGRSASLRLANLTSATRQYSLRLLPSDPVPITDPTLNAGNVALGYLPDNGTAFVPLPNPLTLNLAARQSDVIELELRRRDMAPFTGPAGAGAAAYQSLLEVTDGFGTRLFLPVTAAGSVEPEGILGAARGNANRRSALTAADGDPASPYAGLWAGVVAVNAVNEPRNAQDPVRTRASGGEFQFRILLHVDATGQARLLREALVLFKPGTTAPVPDSNAQQLETPGRYVIATDESLLNLRDPEGNPIYTGSTLRDGERIGRRLSSANFSFDQPLALAGAFGTNGAVLTAQHTLPFNHPLHPFNHVYHPDHDNKDREFNPYSSPGEESWDITRNFQFEFTAIDPDPNAPVQAGFGADILAGRYNETVAGLHKDPLRVAGIFRIQRVLLVDQLNDGR